MPDEVEVKIDRRNWLANNVINLVTVLVLAIASVAVARYKMTVYDNFMETQQKVNENVMKQISEMSYTVNMQAALQEQQNNQVQKVLDGLQESNDYTRRVLAVLEDRADTGYKK